MSTPGISIILCCYNSSERLPATLSHLQKMASPPGPWEVILVDNASTDDTAQIAQTCWDENNVAPFRIIEEPKAGLSHARHTGLRASRHEVIAFIDDDNWVPPHWAKQVAHIFQNDEKIAGAGGPITEVCESTPPDWFETFKGNFTIWEPQDFAGYWQRPLCGAGLCIRKHAWQQLIENGFTSRLSDRTGSQLSSGGDFELCHALLLAGHSLWYDPQLRIQHFMPAQRIRWSYLKRLNEGFGHQSVYLQAYENALLPTNEQRVAHWRSEALGSCYQIMRHLHWFLIDSVGGGEGSAQVLLVRNQIGRLKELLKARGRFDASFSEITDSAK